MTGRTTTRRGVAPRRPWGLLTVVVGLLALSAGPVPGVPEISAADGDEVYDMVFPLLGEHTLTDSFGDPRGRDRRHAGVDLLADRMVPVVAVADGVVRWVHDERGGNCCDVGVLHDDGWRSRYIHLNNDTPGTDDGRAVGIAPGVREGARVQAGQLLGWVGDSGNAESTVPHLHFELRRPDGTPVDPLPSLKAALRTGRQLAPARPPAEERADEGDGEEERRGGLWRWLLGRGDEEGAEEEGETGSEEEEGGDRGGVEPKVAPAPPMPPEEGEPVRPAEEDEAPTLDGTAPPGLPAEEPVLTAEDRPGALPGLGMSRRVEEIPVAATPGEAGPGGAVPGEAGPGEAAERQPRDGGSLLSCFGFSDAEPTDEP